MTNAHFGALHVVDEVEAYACSRAGELYEISEHGIDLRLKWGAALLDVAKFKDSLWLATGDKTGLFRVPPRTQEMKPVPVAHHATTLRHRRTACSSTRRIR